MTPQRQRVLDAVAGLTHSTPEEIVERVAADGGAPMAASTVYRALEALQELGVVGHTHLDHGAPTYHLAGHADHVHLVCRGCGGVDECPADLAAAFVEALRREHGFDADVTHMAVHGRCASCRAGQQDSPSVSQDGKGRTSP